MQTRPDELDTLLGLGVLFCFSFFGPSTRWWGNVVTWNNAYRRALEVFFCFWTCASFFFFFVIPGRLKHFMELETQFL